MHKPRIHHAAISTGILFTEMCDLLHWPGSCDSRCGLPDESSTGLSSADSSIGADGGPRPGPDASCILSPVLRNELSVSSSAADLAQRRLVNTTAKTARQIATSEPTTIPATDDVLSCEVDSPGEPVAVGRPSSVEDVTVSEELRVRVESKLEEVCEGEVLVCIPGGGKGPVGCSKS